MAVPRRFDRRPPERDQTRINERIRAPEVRLVDADGEQMGVLSILAQSHILSLLHCDRPRPKGRGFRKFMRKHLWN